MKGEGERETSQCLVPFAPLVNIYLNIDGSVVRELLGVGGEPAH